MEGDNPVHDLIESISRFMGDKKRKYYTLKLCCYFPRVGLFENAALSWVVNSI